MNKPLSLSERQKLTVTYRVEPGCLGPTGDSKIDGFCSFAQQEIDGLDADYVVWHIIPRTDKSLPEMQFNVMSKRLSHDQAEKYLSRLGKDLEEFEIHLSDKLTDLINQYMNA